MSADGLGGAISRMPDDQVIQRIQRRTLVVVMVSQILGGAGLAAGISVGALLAEDMLGRESLSGVPTALFTLGSALAAYLVGRSAPRLGRRFGLGLGFAAGGIGAAGVVGAAMLDSVPLLFVSLLVYGSGTATNLQARYAGTDLAEPDRRGAAISIAMVATTVGAVAGPNLIDPMGHVAEALGIPTLSGPFLLAAVAYLSAGVVLMALLHPDPYLVARQRERDDAAPTISGTPRTVPRPGRGAVIGATVMVVAQGVMIAVMTMTPVHMRAHHHGLSDVGLVIGVHIGAMFLPSLVTGALVDRIGRIPMALASGVTFLGAGIVGASVSGDSRGGLLIALALLGLAWNFGVIAGTALLVDATVSENRPRVQGSVDVLIALAGAGGGAASGIVMSATDFGVLALGGGVTALLLVPVVLGAWRRPASPPGDTG